MDKQEIVMMVAPKTCPCCGESVSLVATKIDGNSYTLGCIACTPERDWDETEAQIRAAVAFCSGRD